MNAAAVLAEREAIASAETALEFFRVLWDGQDAPGVLCVSTKRAGDSRRSGGLRTVTYSLQELPSAAGYAASYAKLGSHVWAGVGLRRERPDTGKRGSSKDVSAIPGLWFDLDVQSPAHKKQELPESIEEALAFTDSLPLAPTLVVSSGYGLQLYWLFREAWVFEDEQEQAAAASLLKRWQQMIGAAGAARGWTDLDSTHDLARILRVPGTLNLKLSDPRPVQIERAEEGLRYNPDDFEDFLPASAEPPGPSARSQRVGDADEYARRPVAVVRSALASIPPRPDYSDWIRIIAAVLDAVGGDESVAEGLLSEWSPEEVPGEYAEKLAARLDTVGAGTLYYLARENGWVDPETLAGSEIAQRLFTGANRGEEVDPDEAADQADEESPAELEINRGVSGVWLTHDRAFVLGGRRLPRGLWWHGWSKEDKDGNRTPVDTWVASPIHAVATTSGEDGQNWGLLLVFRDTRGRWKSWAMPMRLLAGSGEDLRRELLDLGFRYNPKERARLSDWMMSRYPKRKIIAASRIGWHLSPTGRACFVLPSSTIGSDSVLYQSEHAADYEFRTAGSLDGWRDTIAARCTGNPVLMFAVCVSLTAPLLKIAKLQEVGGALINFHGGSSKGKTTVAEVAAATWGERASFVRTWRATSNGLEATAAGLNDTLLVLDEISEIDPREIGSVVYSLANGTGKQRAAKDGGARDVARWRIIVLSTGERTLAGHMGEAGGHAKAGQEARFLDIPATTRAHGAFDELHGEADGRAFADALKQAASTHYGHAGPTFVRSLIEDPQDFPARLAEIVRRPEFEATDGLELRAASIFALCALAGELASEQGLTGWNEGDATAAAAEMFAVWRARRGTGRSTEERQILRGVRDFILRHGDSRFSSLEGLVRSDAGGKFDWSAEAPVRERAGYWKADPDGKIHLFHSAALQEAAPGFEVKQITEALDAAGWIVDRDNDRSVRSKRTAVPGGKKERLYYVRPGEGAIDDE